MINFYTYAIGDIHGCDDLLRLALELIDADRRRRAVPVRVVLLGDYVDRGDQSRAVLERLAGSPELICLRGNHEDMMLAALSDGSREARRMWLSNGGLDTLRSYGRRGSRADVPESHLAWLRERPHAFEDAHRIYVHAGLEPHVRLVEQKASSLLWIRQRFLAAPTEAFPDGKHIVHGHTPEWAGKPDPSEPELLPHRTNLDTGVYMTDVLTSAMFDDAVPGGPVRLLRVTPEGGRWSDV